MSDLDIYLTTFNCGRELVNVDYFAASLFQGLKTEFPPDLLVLTLQEIAPLGYSFLGGSLLAPYFTSLKDAVYDAARKRFGKDVEYLNVVSRNVGMTALMLFAKHEVSHNIRKIQTAGVGVGTYEMGNKGAVGARITVAGSGQGETSLTFVAAHLAAMEDQCERRNADWRAICEGLVFTSESTPATSSIKATGSSGEEEPLLSATSTKDNGLFIPNTHIFFAGDLNYRTSDSSPPPNSHKSWPQASDSPTSSSHHSKLLKNDQLTRERTANRTLHLLSEEPITFPPTYKLSDAASKAAYEKALHTTTKTLADGRTASLTELDLSSQLPEQEEWIWAEHRTPSWTDRVLYLEALPPKVKSYTALPIQPTSDHRPVAMHFSVSRSAKNEEIEPPFKINEDWKSKRDAARRCELAVGLGAYLGWTWEGEALLAGTIFGVIGGYLALRALLATS